MRWRRGYLKLGLKEVLQGTIGLFSIVWVCLFIIFSLFLSVPLLKFLADYLLAHPELPRDTIFIFGMLPAFYIVTVVVAGIWVIYKVWGYRVGYTLKEKSFLRSEDLKWKKRYGWFGRFYKVRFEDELGRD